MTSRHQKNISLEPATCAWASENGLETPVAKNYDDPYYSQDDGLAEAEYVFIQGNRLAQRFARCKSFTVAETGFGTGLNCYATIATWLKQRRPGANLHYISCERHPMTQADIRRAMQRWPALTDIINDVLQGYPASNEQFCEGLWNIYLPHYSTTITLLFGDARDMLATLDAQVDAWLLDGFSPAKNQAMWDEAVFGQLARLSRPGTSIATFSAARAVKAPLQAAGFNIQRLKGYGRKRHMTVGNFSASTPQTTCNSASTKRLKQEYFLRPTSSTYGSRSIEATVIGGGIAACTTAAHLANLGIKTQLLVPKDGFADGASGVPLATIRPYFDADHSPGSRFYLQSYLTTISNLGGFVDKAAITQHFLDENKNWLLRFNSRFTAAAELIQGSPSGTAHYPGAAMISLKRCCEQLVDIAKSTGNLRVTYSQPVVKLGRISTGWVINTPQQQYLSSNVVVCTGNQLPSIASATLEPSTIRQFRGQTSGFDTPTVDLERANITERALCGNGHIIYSRRSTWFGASYIPNDSSREIRPQEFLKYRGKVAQLDPHIETVNFEQCQHFAATRGTTADHLPIVGPAPDHQLLDKHYQNWHKNRVNKSRLPNASLPGLFFNLAHGSKGATSAQLCAEIVGSYLCSSTLATSMDIAQAIHPARFKLRELRRGK